MNYYSRSSPLKRRKNPPAGFLLPGYQNPSLTSRKTKTKSNFNLSLHQPIMHSSGPCSPRQILILDDQDFYMPVQDQILIEDVEDELFTEIPQVESREQLQLQPFALPKIDVTMNESRNGKKYKDQLKVVQKEHQSLRLEENKGIIRNYSFGGEKGGEQFQMQAISTVKQPLILNIIKSKEFINEKNANTKRKSQKNYKLTQTQQRIQSRISQKKKQESWNKLVKNFIKKREHFKQPLSDRSSNNLSDDANQSTLVKEESIAGGDNEDVESHQTGFFRAQSQESFGHNFTHHEVNGVNKIQGAHYEHSQPRKISEEMNIQDDYEVAEQEAQKKDEQKTQNMQNKDFQNEGNDETDIQERIKLPNSISLISQAINELPQKLVPVYKKLISQLVRRSHETEVTLQRMQQTQEMLSMLICVHKKLINVDDYLLTDFDNAKSEKVFQNQEIILGLVRQLALLM